MAASRKMNGSHVAMIAGAESVPSPLAGAKETSVMRNSYTISVFYIRLLGRHRPQTA